MAGALSPRPILPWPSRAWPGWSISWAQIGHGAGAATSAAAACLSHVPAGAPLWQSVQRAPLTPCSCRFRFGVLLTPLDTANAVENVRSFVVIAKMLCQKLAPVKSRSHWKLPELVRSCFRVACSTPFRFSFPSTRAPETAGATSTTSMSCTAARRERGRALLKAWLMSPESNFR